MNKLELAFLMQQYDRNKTLYKRAIESIKRDIEEYFDDIRAEFIHYIKTRIKSMESIIDKAELKGYKDPFQEMDDIAGIRVVCHNESDRDQVVEFIRLRYRSSILKDEKIKRDDGYRAHHIVVLVEALVAGQLQKAKVEIQSRTIAEDLFGTLSHRDIYKLSTKLPGPWITKMKELGDRLEEVDKIAEDLKQEWIEGNIKTRAKDQLDAQTIKHICDKYSNENMTIHNALNCLANLIRNDITKISELQEVLNDKQTLTEIDNIYQELLGRKADINGKIIYGSLLHKHKSPIAFKPFFIGFIENSIKSSHEYLKRQFSKNSENKE